MDPMQPAPSVYQIRCFSWTLQPAPGVYQIMSFSWNICSLLQVFTRSRASPRPSAACSRCLLDQVLLLDPLQPACSRCILDQVLLLDPPACSGCLLDQKLLLDPLQPAPGPSWTLQPAPGVYQIESFFWILQPAPGVHYQIRSYARNEKCLRCFLDLSLDFIAASRC